MNCPKCQTPAVPGALFCAGCGAELPPQPEADLPSLGNLPTLRDPAAARKFQPGEKLMARYRVLGELGQGGMGVVYRCLDEVGGIEVALKALPPELSHNTGEMEEVRENFQIVEKLHHPCIAAVKTLERDAASGNYYLILELVEGVDLRKWRKQQGGQLALGTTLPVLRQIAEALDYAHSRKIIHRDIKPANVMMSADGTVKVLDFGLAAQIQTSMSRVSQVHFSTSGTGPYMSPEQWKGQRQDGASDQYALAVLAYELLAGHLPFDSAEAMVLQQAVLNSAPEKPEGMGDAVWAALLRGLAKNRTERFANCAEFIAALGGSRGNEARTERVESREQRSEIASQSAIGNRKSKMPLVVAVVVAALVLLASLGWYWGVKKPADEARARQAAAQLAQRQADEAQRQADALAAQKAAAEKTARELAAKLAAEEKARADAAAAQQAAEKQKADELAAQKAAAEKAAQELATKQAAEEKARTDAVAAQQAAEKQKADELAAQKAAAEKAAQELATKQAADEKQRREAETNKLAWLLGTWKVSWTWKPNRLADVLSPAHPGSNLADDWTGEEFVFSHAMIYGYEINNLGIRSTQPGLEGTILESGEIAWKCYLTQYEAGADIFVFHHHGILFSVGNPTDLNGLVWGHSRSEQYYPSGWQDIIACQMSPDHSEMNMVIPCQSSDPTSENPRKWPVKLQFTKVVKAQN